MKSFVVGSFDPLTKGHEFVIKQACELFPEKVYVVVGVNPQKKGMFNTEERVEIIKSFISSSKLSNVEVITSQIEYIASLAKRMGVGVMVKGLRDAKDLDYERTIEQVNSKINAQLKTVYVFPPADLAAVSSSLVKGLVGFVGWHEQVNHYVNSFVYSGIMEKVYEKELSEAWKMVPSDKALDGVWFKKVLRQHSEIHRFYHNTSHLMSLLEKAKSLSFSDKEKSLIYSAIFFHDLVYNPLGKDNEELSAKAWEDFAKETKVSEEDMREVKEMILSTKKHLKTDSELMNKFLDLDLSILAEEEARFLEYENNIRLEYKMVPEEIYSIERTKVMNKLKGPFFSEEAQALWGQQRALNLKNY